MKTSAKSANTFRRFAQVPASIGLVALVLTATSACGTSPAQHAGSADGSATASSAPTGELALAGTTASTGAAPLWSDTALPFPPGPNGHSIAQERQTIVEAEIQNGNATASVSNDGGKTWASYQQALQTPAQSLDIALSGDGQHWLVGPPSMGSAASAVTSTKAYVSAADGTLQPITMPGSAAHAAWAGSTLLVSGGAHNSHLWASTDSGRTFTDISEKLQGFMPPQANSDAPVIGALLQLDGAVAPVLVASSGSGSTATAYISRDGAAFSKVVAVERPGVQPGTLDGVTSAYGANAVIAISRSQFLEITADGQQRTIAAAGLPAGATAINVAFRDATRGIADATLTTCVSGKTNCTTSSGTYETSDGGATWTQTH